MGLVQRQLEAAALAPDGRSSCPRRSAAVWLGTKLVDACSSSDPQGLGGADPAPTASSPSLLPVWLLLQPRGYLGGFVLYMALAVGVLGMFFGGFAIEQPAFKGFDGRGPTGALFPFLFVTIACGACCGLPRPGLLGHDVEADRAARAHCRPVGYGAMLLEAFVAVIALATVMIVQRRRRGRRARGRDLRRRHRAVPDRPHRRGASALRDATFGAMAFSTFIFDTLDVATRLGRYILQELFGRPAARRAWSRRLATVGVPAARC